MKVIFLDFDGVLVTVHDRYTNASPYCVAMLNDITNQTDAKIVVSSSWRCGSTVAELTDTLQRWGVTGEVIGKTPLLRGKKRGYEIQAWLDEHPVKSFVILDDDSDMAHLKSSLVKCHSHHGIDTKQVAKALKVLQQEEQ
jgi:hypothetical protein